MGSISTLEGRREDIIDRVIGIDTLNYDRDSEIVMNAYREHWKRTKSIPDLVSLEEYVYERNYEVAWDISEFDFENSGYDCGELGMRELSYPEYKTEVVSEAATERINELYWYHTTTIREFIEEVISSSGAIYEDNFLNRNQELNALQLLETSVIRGDSQLILYHDMLPSRDAENDYRLIPRNQLRLKG